MNNEKENAINNQKGQTFLEFIFLLLMLVTISFTFLKGVSTFVGTRWETMVKIVAKPNASDVTMP